MRTEVATNLFPADLSKTPYTICPARDTSMIGEYVGGFMTFGNDCSIQWTNPAIAFSSTADIVDWTGVAMSALTSTTADVKILSSDQTCPGQQPSFMTTGGLIYRFDSRLELINNSLQHPASSSSATSCPVVPKTFLNKASCVRKPSCAHLSFSSAAFELNNANLIKYYTDSSKFVYHVSGLRLSSPFDVSPCTGPSRWLKHSGNCPGGETGMSAGTRATMVGALTGSTDSNPFVRDIDMTVSGTECDSGSSLVGAQLQVDNAVCWEHVHPDTHNVYDFSLWATQHAGGSSAISKFAEAGSAELLFPALHDMQRWASKRDGFSRLGRLGDTVDFAQLPTVVQTVEMAQHVGSTGDHAGVAVETCGSPGEVANVPSMGHHYKLWTVYKTDNPLVEGLEANYRVENGRIMTWTNIALKADDQLAQRMAWALSQILVIGESGFSEANRCSTL